MATCVGLPVPTSCGFLYHVGHELAVGIRGVTRLAGISTEIGQTIRSLFLGKLPSCIRAWERCQKKHV